MKKIRLYVLLLTAVLVLLLTAGVSYAWLTRQEASMDTLLSILPPDTIIIIPVGEDGELLQGQELNLDFRDREEDTMYKDYIDGNGKIHILRPVCVKSSYPAHRLEVVRTTNLENLSFHIYSAPWNKKTQSFELPREDSREELNGGYCNLKDGYNSDYGTPKLARPEKTLNKNYEDRDDVHVEDHAYPLYWLAGRISKHGVGSDLTYFGVTAKTQTEDDPLTGESRLFYYTFYYLDITWKEETKQTDLFYILAQNVAE